MPRPSRYSPLLLGLLLVMCVRIAGVSAATDPVLSYTPTISGQAVQFGLGGFEPDMDPIYHMTVSAILHDPRTVVKAVPDVMLVLSTYIEVFQPDTTPLLPDILHPTQIASALTAFISGKSTLVNAARQVIYKGTFLSEVFTNNQEHVIVDLFAPGGLTPVLRLAGVITLHANAAETGSLTVIGAPTVLAPFIVPAAQRGPFPSWQVVAATMSVRPPAMVGTASSASTPRGSHPNQLAWKPSPTRLRPATSVWENTLASPFARAFVVFAISASILLLVWRPRRRQPLPDGAIVSQRSS